MPCNIACRRQSLRYAGALGGGASQSLEGIVSGEQNDCVETKKIDFKLNFFKHNVFDGNDAVVHGVHNALEADDEHRLVVHSRHHGRAGAEV